MATASESGDAMVLDQPVQQEDAAVKVSNDGDSLEAALFEMVRAANTKKKLSACKASIRHIVKCIQRVLKSPHDHKARRLLLKNFTLKKFVVDVSGGLNVAAAVGFVATGDSQIEIPEDRALDTAFLENALKKLQDKANRVEEELARPEEHSSERQQCLGKCGFFGNDETDGYCSVCYRNKMTGRNSGPAEECKKTGCQNFGSDAREGLCNSCWREQQKQNSGWQRRWRIVRIVVLASIRLQRSVVQRPQQTDQRKCWHCKRKIALTAVPCRCGYRFCDKHRSTLDHQCTFDFRRAHKLALERANPTVTGKKFNRLD